jgi:hypothetical protein
LGEEYRNENEFEKFVEALLWPYEDRAYVIGKQRANGFMDIAVYRWSKGRLLQHKTFNNIYFNNLSEFAECLKFVRGRKHKLVIK